MPRGTVAGNTATITAVDPVYIFRPPVRMTDGPRWNSKSTPLEKALWQHVPRPGPAVAVLITGGSVAEKQYPTHDELEAADSYWMGGRENRINAGEKATLEAAGYGAFITEVV